MHYNGLQWECLAIRLMDLFSALGKEADALPGRWEPPLPCGEPPQVAADAWRVIEAGYRESIHAAARAAISTPGAPTLSPEIGYFLSLRVRAVLIHVEAMFAIKNEKPVSLWAFPALPPEEVIEWLLTDWADDHAIMTAFPSMGAPCAHRTSDFSFLAPTF